MMATYYAICHVNGPISHAIDAESVDAALAAFAAADSGDWIDNAACDAEDDFDICCDGMSESDFDDVMTSVGYERVAIIDGNASHPSSPMLAVTQIAGGWSLWGPSAE